MKEPIKQLYDENFDFKFKASTYNNITIATTAFSRFVHENEKFFSFDKKKTMLGHLLTYVVEKQFNDAAFTPTSSYSVHMKEVNKCRHKALFLDTKNFTVNLGRTLKRENLPYPSKYKKKLAENNIDFNNQFSLFEPQQIGFIEYPKYALITYNYYMGKVNHLDLLLPTHDFKKIYHAENLLENVGIYQGYVLDEIVETNIVSLKTGLEIEAFENNK